MDVELKRYPPIRGVVGSVGRPNDEPLAVVILDADWRRAGLGNMVPEDSPIALLAAHLAINEPGGEQPWRNVNVQGLEHYRVDSRYVAEASRRLEADKS